jgi:alpha-galactosidase
LELNMKRKWLSLLLCGGILAALIAFAIPSQSQIIGGGSGVIGGGGAVSGLKATGPQLNAAASLATDISRQARVFSDRIASLKPTLPADVVGLWDFTGLPAGTTYVKNSRSNGSGLNLVPATSEPCVLTDATVGSQITVSTTPFQPSRDGGISGGFHFPATGDNNNGRVTFIPPTVTDGAHYSFSCYVIFDDATYTPSDSSDIVMYPFGTSQTTPTKTVIRAPSGSVPGLFRYSVDAVPTAGTYHNYFRIENKGSVAGKPFTISGIQITAGTTLLPYERRLDMVLAGTSPAPVFTPRGTILGGGNTAGSAGTSSYAVTPGIANFNINGPWTVISVCRVISSMNNTGSFIDLSIADRSAATQAIYCQHGNNRALMLSQNGSSSDVTSTTFMTHPYGQESVVLFLSKPIAGSGGPKLNAIEKTEVTHSGSAGIGVGCLAFSTPSYIVDLLEVSCVICVNSDITDDERYQAYLWLVQYLEPKGIDIRNSLPPVLTHLQSNETSPLPAMGWNSWFNSSYFDVNDAMVRRNAAALVSTGLKAAGYNYCIASAGWEPHTGTLRDASGSLIPDATKFPNGMKPVSEYVRSLGLKFGTYSSAAPIADTYGYTGSAGHEDQDAATFADWNAEWLHYDVTYRDTTGREPIWGHEFVQELFQRISVGLRKAGASTHICAGIGFNNKNAICVSAGINSVRFGLDAAPGASASASLMGLFTLFDTTSSVTQATWFGNGFYPDCDGLLVGCGLTDEEGRTQFSIYSILMAPLICGCELDATTAESNTNAGYNDPAKTFAGTIATLSNADVIAVDQDAMQLCGIRVANDSTNHTDVWVRPLANGDWAILFVNRDNSNARSIAVTWADIGTAVTSAQSTLTSYPAFPSSFSSGKNLWTKASTGALATGFTEVNVPVHGCVMLRVTP